MSLLTIIVAYLLGSVSTGYLAGKFLKGIDVREYGSKSVGTTNILRTIGPAAAVLVLALDVGKGLIVIFLADWLVGTPTVVMLSGLAAVIGHNWPVYFGFRGGKGIATSLGVIAGLSLPVLGVITVLGVLIIILTRYVSLASLTGAAIFPLLLWILRETSRIEVTPLVVLISTLLSLLAIIRHRDNIKRLLKGQENKVGKKVNI